MSETKEKEKPSTLEEAIQRTCTNLLSDERLVELVEKSVEKTVASAVNDALQSYSDIGKQIRAAVGASLQIGTIELPAYHETVMEIVRRKIAAVIEESGRKRIEEDLEAILAATAPKEICLSDLVDKMKEHHMGNSCHCDLTHCSVLVEPLSINSGSMMVGLDPEPKKTSWHGCAYRLHVKEDGRLLSLDLHGEEWRKEVRPLFFGPFWDFEKLLFHLWAGESKIHLDEDRVCTWYPAHD